MREYTRRSISPPVYPQPIEKCPPVDSASIPRNRDKYPIQYVNEGNVHFLNVNSHGQLYAGAQCADALLSTNGPPDQHHVRFNVVPLGRQLITTSSVRRQTSATERRRPGSSGRNRSTNAFKYSADRFSGSCAYPTSELSDCRLSLTHLPRRIATIVDSNTNVNTLDDVKLMLDSEICSKASFESTPKVFVQIKNLRSPKMAQRNDSSSVPILEPVDLQIPNDKDANTCRCSRSVDSSEETVVLARLDSISTIDVSEQMENIDEMTESVTFGAPRYPQTGGSETSIQRVQTINIEDPIALPRFDFNPSDGKVDQVQRIRNMISCIKRDLNELLQLQTASRITK